MFYSFSLMYSNIFIVFLMPREGFSQRPEGFWMAFSCHKPKIETVFEEQGLFPSFPRWRDWTHLGWL